MRRPHAIFLKDHDSELYIAFESNEAREQWMEKMLQALVDLKVWKLSCDFLIPLPSSKFYVDSPSTYYTPKLKTSERSSLTQL